MDLLIDFYRSFIALLPEEIKNNSHSETLRKSQNVSWTTGAQHVYAYPHPRNDAKWLRVGV